MKLCYQVATPDVAIAPSVTAYQGNLATSLAELAAMGYDGVEFMTLDPDRLDWQEIQSLLAQNRLSVTLICTGEVWGQLGLSFTDPDPSVRMSAILRVKRLVDFAAFLHADVNIGRVRGTYRSDVSPEQTEHWAIAAFREIAEFAAPQGVTILLESVTIMQTNFVNTIAEAAALVDRVGHPNFKIMMDIFHLNLEEKDIVSTIQRYSSYNRYVHLADNNRRYPGNCGLDFERILRAFKDTGYHGTFCTEIMQLPSQEDAARNSIAYLGPILNRVYG